MGRTTIRVVATRGGRVNGLARRLVVGLASLVILAGLPGCLMSGGRPSNNPTPAAEIHFADVTQAAGLRYRWTVPTKDKTTILDTLGGGCGFLDYDNDGNLDVLLVGPKLALFRGDGRGRFTDVTHQTGLDRLSGRFLGCAVGDYDNDGFDDIYISGYRTGLLLHNEGGKGFRDVMRQVGLRPQPWGTSCAWADLDGDGWLDLYVADYVKFGPETQPQLCRHDDGYSACPPNFYMGVKGALHHNLGGRRFEDVTVPWGLGSATGKGLGVAVADFDGSGRPGLAVANDEVPGDLFQPVKSGRFENIGVASGTAYDGNGNVHGGMGVDWGDYDNDGRLDLVVGTFQDQSKSVYRNLGHGVFSDLSDAAGVGKPGMPFVTFGCKLFDFDNDGWLDLILANGDVQGYHERHPGWSYRQPAQLFHNQGGTPATFVDISPTAGAAFQERIVGRALAVGDYDNDGRPDVLLTDADGGPVLLHNECPAGHWLDVRLVGTKSNRDGLGAQLSLSIAGRSLLRQCGTDGSYLSASDRRVHFGLGRATVAQSLKVRWPSGHTDLYTNLSADRCVTIREGSPAVR